MQLLILLDFWTAPSKKFTQASPEMKFSSTVVSPLLVLNMIMGTRFYAFTGQCVLLEGNQSKWYRQSIVSPLSLSLYTHTSVNVKRKYFVVTTMMARSGKLVEITAPADSAYKKRIFSVTPDHHKGEVGNLPLVILENLILKLDHQRSSGNSSPASSSQMDGGCILVKRAHLTLTNVIFQGCAASSNGGGLYIVRRFETLRFISPT